MKKHRSQAFMLASMLLLFTLTILSSIKPSQAATTKVIAEPSNVTAAVGSIFSINVTIVDVVDLYGFEIRFWWDPTVLYYQSKYVYIPKDTNPDGILWNPYVKPIDIASRTAGTYRLVATSQNPAPSFNSTASDGKVFRLTFQVLKEGATWLHFTSTDLTDRTGAVISHVAEDGHFTTNVANRAPLANFTFSPDKIYVSRTNVAFDASQSYDPDGGAILKYMWDFGDLTKENTTTPTAYHTYSSEGFFTVNLRVLDEEDSYSPPFPNQKPLSVAKFCDVAVTSVSVSPQELARGLNATVNANFKNTGDANVTAATMIAYYNKTAIDPGNIPATDWEQIGNQTINRHPVIDPWKPGDDLSLTFNWDTTGVESKAYYWIMINVTYSLPIDHNATNNVKLSNNSIRIVALPAPSFTYLPSLPRENQMITFDASASYDPDGIITKYHWDFGDGNTKTYIQGVNLTSTTTHQYPASAVYLVNLTLTDDDGASNSTTREVGVAGLPPEAFFKYTPAFPVECEEISFNATGSYSPKGANIVKYRWEFGDGSSVEETDPAVTHRYVNAGAYTINLTVTDQFGLTGNITKSLVVTRSFIEVETDVGVVHFAGEKAEFYVLIKFLGAPTDATDPLNARLYYFGAYTATLTAEPVATGLYRMSYTIPGTASSGTYTLLIQAKYYSMESSTMKSFLISDTLAKENAWLKEIKGNITTIVTRTGEIQLDLSQINARVLSINGTVGIIDSTLGEIVVPDITAINATLKDIIIDSKGEILARIDYFLGSSGTITTTLKDINAKVIAINGNVLAIQTDIGTIETDVGNVQSATTTPLYVTSAFSAASALIAAIVLLLLRKRPT